MFRIMFESAPSYLRQLFQVNRSSYMNKITTTIPRTDLFKSSLTYSSAVLWNSLTESQKKPKPMSASSFKSRLLTHLKQKPLSLDDTLSDGTNH